MPRREFSRKVRAAAVDRANGHCERCRAVLKPGEGEFDHVLPAALGGEATLANCQLLCRQCHRGPEGKTTQDVRRIRKADRQRDKASGAIRPTGRLKGPGSPKFPKPQRIEKRSLPPRKMFEDRP